MTLLSLINGLVKRCFQRCDAVNLKDLKDYIRELYKPPALGNDGAVIKFMSDEFTYSSRRHQNHLTPEPSLKCVSSMGLAKTRILMDWKRALRQSPSTYRTSPQKVSVPTLISSRNFPV
ncbi:hypothetical protein GLOIN_2v1883277 [Rhizophagus irregularis DAOM 181602=DAOM 197198]|nr:hypothetical protein GLOIN_2v1883277 [Rhizophagus irregularis DAOM 181602=DAOM 197198]